MMGPFIFSILTTHLVNPDSASETVIIYNKDGSVKIKFYAKEIADNTPGMLRTISYIFTVFCVLSVALVFRREQNEDPNK